MVESLASGDIALAVNEISNFRYSLLNSKSQL